MRYRRLKAALVNAAAAHGLEGVLRPLLAVRKAAAQETSPERAAELPSCYALAARWAATLTLSSESAS